MELSLFLAQLFGVYFIIVGLAVLLRPGMMKEIIVSLRGNHVLMILIALAQIVAGAAIAITHSVWSSDFRVVITIIGYWMILEGIFYLLISKKALRKFLGWFMHPMWYSGGGVIALIFGIALAGIGFGWWM